MKISQKILSLIEEASYEALENTVDIKVYGRLSDSLYAFQDLKWTPEVQSVIKELDDTSFKDQDVLAISTTQQSKVFHTHIMKLKKNSKAVGAIHVWNKKDLNMSVDYVIRKTDKDKMDVFEEK